MINLTELNLTKGQALARLYNAAKPIGLGRYAFDATEMTEATADELLEHSLYFDYLKGRVMKVNLATPELDERLYDRDNGTGAALAALTHQPTTEETT